MFESSRGVIVAAWDAIECCPHRDPEDGCCLHEANPTPECNGAVCPLVTRAGGTVSGGTAFGITELEARAKYPPNCERCVWVPPFGLMRCLSCALAAMARANMERAADAH
jgi:hypothetical protein